jgi:hypothetical protein
MLDAEATMAAFERKGKVVVQDDAQVMAPLEVTLDDIARQRAVDHEANQPTAEGYAKAEVPDLKSIVLSRVELMGPAAASVYFQRPVKVVRKWIEGTAEPGLEDLTKALERPASTEDRQATKSIEVLSRFDLPNGDLAVTQSQPRTPVQILIASKGDVPLPVAVSWVALALRQAPFFRWRADTMIVRSRNLLTDDFLRTNMQWALFLDSDVIPPLGSPWFSEVTGPRKLPMQALECDLIPRLLSHNQPVVGGLYAGRAEGASLIAQPDLVPADDRDRELAESLRTGQANGLHRVKWAAAGCLLIHRDVFLKVREVCASEFNVPDNEAWPYWSPIGNEGEDLALCRRIDQCGIPIHLDGSCVLGHLGKKWFLPEHSIAPKRL